MIPSMEAVRAVSFHRKDALVVATSAALRDWSAVSQRRDLDVDLKDCMNLAPAVGLGLALARPDSRVMVLDCDATLRTDPGGLVTVGQSGPENLVHLVFDDVSNSSTQGLPLGQRDRMDFTAMARGAGYARTYQFDDLEELVLGLEEAMAQPGPVFVLLQVGPAEGAAMPGRSMAEGWAAVRRTLAARE